MTRAGMARVAGNGVKTDGRRRPGRKAPASTAGRGGAGPSPRTQCRRRHGRQTGLTDMSSASLPIRSRYVGHRLELPKNRRRPDPVPILPAPTRRAPPLARALACRAFFVCRPAPRLRGRDAKIANARTSLRLNRVAGRPQIIGSRGASLAVARHGATEEPFAASINIPD